MKLENVIKSIEQKVEFTKKFGLPKNPKEYKGFKKVMKNIDKTNQTNY